MAMTFEQLKEIRNKETVEFHKIDRWHKMGYKGKGINFLELEPDNEHCKIVTGDSGFKMVAPESKVFKSSYSARTSNGKLMYCKIGGIDAKEYIKSNNISIIGASLASKDGGMTSQVEQYFRDLGVVLIGAAGNDGAYGVTGIFENIGIIIGSIFINEHNEILPERYSGRNEETIDFASLHGVIEGTSLSSPVICGIVALIFSRYYILNQSQVYDLLKKMCIKQIGDKAGNTKHDMITGWGVPILPERIAMLEIDKNRLYNVDEVIEIIRRYNKEELHIHHTWSPCIADFSGSNHLALQKGMRNYHVNNRGFSDIAQHLTLFPDGNFLFGRNLKEEPCSSYGCRPDGSYWNQDFVLMVETIGNFDKEYIPGVVWAALVKLAAEFESKDKKSLFHREMDPRKSCPGNLLIKENFMKEVKLEVVKMAVERVFKDLDPADWSNEDVKWCKEKGILNGSLEDIDGDGIKDKVVHPDVMIKRKEVAAVIHRAYEVLLEEVIEEVKKLI